MGHIAGFALIVCGVILPEVTGFFASDYDATSQYLSELGAHGAPTQYVIQNFGFLPVGLGSFAILVLLWNRLPASVPTRLGIACLFGITIGYLSAFFFPCDLGCPAEGSASQAIHNLAGLIQYVGVVFGLILILIGLRATAPTYFFSLTLAAACLIVLGVTLLFIPDFSYMRGMSQRLVDYTMFIWLVLTVTAYRNKASA